MPTRSCHRLDSHIVHVNLMFGFLTHTFEQEIIFDIIVECYTVRAERWGYNIVDLETFILCF